MCIKFVLIFFRTHCGVIHGSDPKNITAPTVMWVKALDLLLDQLGADGADFSKLAAVSGSGQVSYLISFTT